MTPHFLICFSLAWLITNGWAYIGFLIGSLFKWHWLTGVSLTYLGFLWMPFTPEKIVTIIIAMALSRFFFPDDDENLRAIETIKHHRRKKQP